MTSRPESNEVEVVCDDLLWAESPRFHAGVLWVSDTQSSRLVEIEGTSARSHPVDPPVNGTAVDADGRVVAARMTGAGVDRFDGERWEVVADLAPLGAGRLGDLTMRADGTVYVDDLGSQGHTGKVEATGRLIAIDPHGKASVAAEGLVFPNGMALIEDETTLVVAETFAHRLTAFAVAADGSLSAPRPWIDLEAELGEEHIPDGIWAEADGSVWVATATGEAVVRVREKEVLERIDLGNFAIACCLDEDQRSLYICAAASTDPSLTVLEAVADKRLRAWVECHPLEVR